MWCFHGNKKWPCWKGGQFGKQILSRPFLQKDTQVHLTWLRRYFQQQNHHHLSKKKKKIIFWLHVIVIVNCQLWESLLHGGVSLSWHFFLQISIMQNVAQTKHQLFQKDGNSINLVFCFNSGPGTGFRMEYRYSENTPKSTLRAAALFRVY